MSNIFYAIETSHPLSMSFGTGLCIGVSSLTRYNEEKEIRADIQKTVLQSRVSDFNLVLIGYDTRSLQPARLEAIIAKINAKKRRKDYQLKVIAASEFTRSIDEYLLTNFYTPDLTFVAIWFNDTPLRSVIYVDD